MLGSVFAVISMLCFGASPIFLQGPIRKYGIFPAIMADYTFSSVLVLLATLYFGGLSLPDRGTLLLLAFTDVIGAVAILSFYKAMEEGELSIVGPFSQLYVLVTIAISVFLFSEPFGAIRLFGATIMLLCALAIGIQRFQFKSLEKGVLYSLVTVTGWGVFFAALKPLALSLGPFNTTLYTQSGIFLLLLLFVLATRKSLSISTKSAASVLVRSTLLTIGALTFNFAIPSIGVALTAAINAGSPAILAILSTTVLHEKIPNYKYVAIAGIVISLGILATG